MKFSRLHALAVVLPLLWLQSALVASTTLSEGYSIRLWRTEDGLPQNRVTSAVQTAEGHLWFSTYSGLARFDGETFSVLDTASTPALPDLRVSALFETPDLTVWIGYESGALTSYSRGILKTILPPTGTFGDKIIGIGTDSLGQLWAMREKGTLVNLTGGDEVASLIGENRPNEMHWSRGQDGKIWVAENGKAAFLTPAGLVGIDIETPGNYTYVFGISAARQGGAWILCDNQIRRWKDGDWVESRGRYAWPNGSISSVCELEDGTVAVGTIQSGLYLVRPRGEPTIAFNAGKDLPQNWIRFISQDREGGIWVGVGTSGVARIQPSPFTIIDSPDRWKGCNVISVHANYDDLWIGTEGAGLYHLSRYGWRNYSSEEGLANTYISSVNMTPEGTLYVGNFFYGSPLQLRNGRLYRHPSLADNSSPVYALHPGKAPDEVYAGTRRGLLTLRASSANILIPSLNDRFGPVTSIAVAPDDALWCGFEEGGLARYEQGHVSRIHSENGLPTDRIRCLHIDGDNVLWIGTADQGLLRYKSGRFFAFGTSHGIVDNNVGKILEDESGHLWLGTHRGLQRIAKAELEACAEGATKEVSSQIYNHHDGLPTIEINGGLQNAATRDAKGRLWFTSNQGLISISPESVRHNSTPPPVILESMIVDGVNVPLSPNESNVKLEPSFERLEFRFSGLSFAAPEKVRFRYRLEGIDREWIDSSTRRFSFYSRLPAGEYTFRVIACNNDNVWNTTGASVTFVVRPFFWNTWWFATGCLVFTGSFTAWLALRLAKNRSRRRIERILQEHAVELERKRIAQDIHDDIGSMLSQIAMLSQPAPTELTKPGKPAAVLVRIYSMAKEMTRSLDEIVWAVDPRHDSLEALLVYMGKHAQGFLSDARIRCRLRIPVELPNVIVTADMRHSLFLAFKEALNNAATHAAASEIRISFQHSEQGNFILEIKDDGCGFDLASRKRGSSNSDTGGNGLSNMQQRLQRIGGVCQISSERGAGTTVTFVFHVKKHTAAPEPDEANRR